LYLRFGEKGNLNHQENRDQRGEEEHKGKECPKKNWKEKGSAERRSLSKTGDGKEEEFRERL